MTIVELECGLGPILAAESATNVELCLVIVFEVLASHALEDRPAESGWQEERCCEIESKFFETDALGDRPEKL